MTSPRVEDNLLLHDVWEPWARRARYFRRSRGHCVWWYDERVSPDPYRHIARQQCSWAVPNEAALAALARHAPGGKLLEVGAGRGYWAHMAEARGMDVIALDDWSDGADAECYGRWFPRQLRAEGSAWLREHGGSPDRALFMCWPSYDFEGEPPVPADAVLAAYRGDVLVLVGERLRERDQAHGCTWWPLRETLQEGGWREQEAVWLPNWPGMRDELVIFKRRGAT